MRNYLKCSLFLFLSILISATAFAQQKIDSISIRRNLDSALIKVQMKDSMFLSSDFQEQLKGEYCTTLLALKKTYDAKPEMQRLVRKYAQSKNMEPLLRIIIRGAGEGSEELISISNMLSKEFKSYDKMPKSKPSSPVIGSEVPNKYATLLIKVVPEKSDALVYLNGRKICKVVQAKNGIKVHSEKQYIVEVKSGNRSLCSKNIVLQRQEKKLNTCMIQN